MDLAAYEELKFELAGLLRGLRRPDAGPGTAEPEALRELFARLAEDRFNLAVVGRFSRGKTSLMNAILGTDLLPVGVLPLTSVITQVSYGSEPRAVLHYRNTNLFMDVPIPELARHITERGNPGNRRGISAAEVQLPAEFLRRGFTFVDTPGLGSAIRANTRTTEAFLPDADALILVSSHDSPLSEEEADILATAQASGRPLFVVLNKQDTVDAAARAEALAHVAVVVREAGGAAPAAVFSVSARDGLAARLAGDAARLAASGLPELEQALVTFLLTRRRTSFLAGMCARIAPLLEAAPVPEDLRRRLAALRARIAADDTATAATSAGPAPLAPLLPGCEICAAIDRQVFDALATIQAVLYSDPAAQATLAQGGGFCRFHAARFQKIAATREACTAATPVLRRQAAALRRLDPADPAVAAQTAALLPGGATCPACAVAQQEEARALAALAGLVATRGADAVHVRSALCLPHLAPLLAAVPVGPARSTLLARQAALMERLAEDAQRYALQQDGAHRDRASKEDLAAADRAARVLLDHPGAQHERTAAAPEAGDR